LKAKTKQRTLKAAGKNIRAEDERSWLKFVLLNFISEQLHFGIPFHLTFLRFALSELHFLKVFVSFEPVSSPFA